MSDELLSQEEIEKLMAQAQGEAAQSGDASSEPQVGDLQASAVNPANQVIDQGDDQGQVLQVATGAKNEDPNVRRAEFGSIGQGCGAGITHGIDLIMDVQLHVAVELGRAKMRVKDVLSLGPGSVVELDKHAGEPVEVVVNNKPIARGEVVVIDENFGIRITEIIDKQERETRAKAA